MEEHGRRRKRLSARLSRRCRAAYLGRRAVRLAAVTQGHRARNRVSWAVRAASAHAADPIKIGHVAALSGASAQSGEAITRGLSLAIDEINAKGGLLGGRMLEVVQRDDESNPPKGLIAARSLSPPTWRQSSAASTRRCRWPWCRCSTRRSASTWACGPPAPASRATAPLPTTPSAFRRWMPWSTCGCSPMRTRSSARRKPA